MSTPDSPEQPGCGVCSSPTGDGGRLCRTHSDELHRDLTTVVDWLAAELETTITRQDRIVAERHGGRSAERPLAYNHHASDKAAVLNATINAWALDVSRLAEDERDQLGEHHYTDTPAVASWLARNLHTLRQHQEAGQAYDELTNAVREARRAVDRPLDYIPLGQCGNDVDLDEPCPAVLYGHPQRQQATCRNCGAQHRIADRLEWMLGHLRGLLVTLPEAVGICRLAGKSTTEDKLRLMASRDRFSAKGVSGGKPTYRMAEVLKALDERYKHRKPQAA